MAKKVLLATPKVHERARGEYERLAAAGLEVVTNDLGRKLSGDELIARLPGVFATVAGGEPYDERVLAAAPELKVIARSGVGHDQVDVAAASRHGVVVAMAFGANHEAVADHAFALMAGLASQLIHYHAEVLAGEGWGGHVHAPLFQQTVGIVGLGRIGRALAARCHGFQMRVLAYDAVPDPAYAEAHGIELVDLDTLFAEADFVSLHAPHMASTDKLANAARLALMKPTAFLINTARGGLIDETALFDTLQAGRIAGAGLDVFEVEPLPAGSPLRQLANVLLTPHAAGGNTDSALLMARRCTDNVLALAEGRSPGDEFLLNPEVLRH